VRTVHFTLTDFVTLFDGFQAYLSYIKGQTPDKTSSNKVQHSFSVWTGSSYVILVEQKIFDTNLTYGMISVAIGTFGGIF